MCSLLSPSHRRPAHAEVGTGSRQSMVILLCCGPFYRSTTQLGCKKRGFSNSGPTAPPTPRSSQNKKQNKTPPPHTKTYQRCFGIWKKIIRQQLVKRDRIAVQIRITVLNNVRKKLQNKRKHLKIPAFEGRNQFTSTGWNSQSVFFFPFLFLSLSLFVKGQIAQLERSISY